MPSSFGYVLHTLYDISTDQEALRYLGEGPLNELMGITPLMNDISWAIANDRGTPYSIYILSLSSEIFIIIICHHFP